MCAEYSRWAQIGETYDWRLGVPNLEVRDGYFTRLKRSIEITHQLHNEKVLARNYTGSPVLLAARLLPDRPPGLV